MGDLAVYALLSLKQVELHNLKLPCNYKQHKTISKVINLPVGGRIMVSNNCFLAVYEGLAI